MCVFSGFHPVNLEGRTWNTFKQYSDLLLSFEIYVVIFIHSFLCCFGQKHLARQQNFTLFFTVLIYNRTALYNRETVPRAPPRKVAGHGACICPEQPLHE